MSITIPVWLLWTLGITGGAIAFVILGILIAAFIMNHSGGWGPWR